MVMTIMEANEKLDLLLKFHSQMAGKNHFELLGVQEDVNDEAVRSAYFALLKTYNADYFHHVTDPEKRKAIDEVNRQLRVAYDTLMKQSSREAYLASIKGTAPAEAEKEIDIADVFEADQALSQARSLMERGDFRIAITKLEKAVKLDPKSIESSVRLTYAKFMMSDVNASGKRDSKLVDETREKLKTACEELPNADYLRVYLGNIEKLEGNSSAALTWFKKALRINPNNMWAKREIHMAENAADSKKPAQNNKEDETPETETAESGLMGQIKGLIKKLNNIKLF